MNVNGPTPADIAARAYSLTVAVVRQRLEASATPAGQAYMRDAVCELEVQREKQLAELRESIINPGAIPWWAKK